MRSGAESRTPRPRRAEPACALDKAQFEERKALVDRLAQGVTETQGHPEGFRPSLRAGIRPREPACELYRTLTSVLSVPDLPN